MAQQPDKPLIQLGLASGEGGLLGALLVFHQRIMTLLRGSSLAEEKVKLVSEQVMLLLDDATAEMKRSKDLDLHGRLESVYEQAKRLVDDLSKTQG